VFTDRVLDRSLASLAIDVSRTRTLREVEDMTWSSAPSATRHWKRPLHRTGDSTVTLDSIAVFDSI
jgi:hypothetical protein